MWVNPQLFTADETNIAQLAQYLDLTVETIQQRLGTQDNREFVYLKRQLAPSEAAQIQALNLSGVFVEREYRRYYPTGEVAAHVVGFTDI